MMKSNFIKYILVVAVCSMAIIPSIAFARADDRDRARGGQHGGDGARGGDSDYGRGGDGGRGGDSDNGRGGNGGDGGNGRQGGGKGGQGGQGPGGNGNSGRDGIKK